MFCNKCGRQIPDGSVCPCQQAPQQPQYQQAPVAPPRPTRPAMAVSPIAKFTLDKIVAIFVTVLTFGLHFINWYGLKDYDSSSNFGPYGVDSMYGDIGLGDFSWLLVVVMILCIINIIVFVAYLAASVINLGAFVPALAGKDLGKLLHKVFYGILILCLILGMIGAIVGEYNYTKYEDYDEYYEYRTEDLDDVKEYFREYPDYAKDIYDVSSYDRYVEKLEEDIESDWADMCPQTKLAAGWWVTLVFTLIGLVFVIKPDLVSSLTNKVKVANAAAMNGQPPYYPQN